MNKEESQMLDKSLPWTSDYQFPSKILLADDGQGNLLTYADDGKGTLVPIPVQFLETDDGAKTAENSIRK